MLAVPTVLSAWRSWQPITHTGATSSAGAWRIEEIIALRSIYATTCCRCRDGSSLWVSIHTKLT
jgi:hypothetical protein